MNDDKMRFATEKGFVVYEKCGIIEIEKVPSFGEVTRSEERRVGKESSSRRSP